MQKNNSAFVVSALSRVALRGLFAVTSLVVATTVLAQTLVVGRSLPLTGPLQAIGEFKRDGGDAYFHKVNASGGVGGRRIDLITLDDGYVADTTVANLKRIASESKPVAFVGLLRVPTAGDHIPLLDELKIPVVGISSATHLLRTRHNRYGFPVRASVTDEGLKLAGHIKVVGIERVAIIYQDVALGHATRQAVDDGLKKINLRADTVMLDAAGKQAAEAARQAIQAKPQAIVLGVLTPAAAALLLELRKQSFNGAVYTFSSTDANVLNRLVGDKALGVAISQIVPMPEGARVKVVAEYIEAVKELGRGRPTLLGLEGFLEAKVLVEGLKRAGVNPSPEAVVKGLETMRDIDLGGFFVTYSPQAHTGSLFVEIDMIGPGGKLMR